MSALRRATSNLTSNLLQPSQEGGSRTDSLCTAPEPSPNLLTMKFGAGERSKKATKSPKHWGNGSPAFRWPGCWDPLSLLRTPGHMCLSLLVLLISALKEDKGLTFKRLF